MAKSIARPSLSGELCKFLAGFDGRMSELPGRGQQVRQEYAEWLQGYRWDYFLTSTFRQPRKEPYYALQSVWHELEHHGAARGFLCVEPHESGDLHIHGVIAGPAAGWQPAIELPADVWSGLYKRFGRARVESCASRERVSLYCAKYLLKQQSRVCDYYEVFGNKLHWREGRS